ncbi:MAG: deoxyribodipyrimidine photolyase [Deltaproteobacteria bacterium]|nr:deoxyribodipyrimidine photolyase [Deltaproteobacteria bacterium]
MAPVPAIRVRTFTDTPLRDDGDFVLYWMTSARRPHHNFSLDHAVDLAMQVGKPLLVLEALRVGYPWACDRFHRFVIDGMRDQAESFGRHDIRYHPYVEREPGDGKGLLKALAKHACAVVTDDFPTFFLPRMLEAAADQLEEIVRLDVVDTNGLYPMLDTDKVFSRAHDFRRHLQKNLLRHLEDTPLERPFVGKDVSGAVIPRAILDRWPAAPKALLEGDEGLDAFPIDHTIEAAALRGGHQAGEARLASFLANDLERYGDGRNHPDDDAASGLSPYLHFGFVSAHDLFARVTEREGWTAEKQPTKATGQRSWWAMSEAAQSFLDEAITWREVGYNMCSHRADHADYESLPDWARATLEEHASDEREHVYSLEEFARAETHDPVWNAAQRQLSETGVMHNYLRMLWGKKILEWTEHPRDALAIMVELNNRYALDGRNPNSYSGIFWVLGRYDRAWGPERPIYGKIRYMTSASTQRKLRMRDYLERWTTPSERAS